MSNAWALKQLHGGAEQLDLAICCGDADATPGGATWQAKTS